MTPSKPLKAAGREFWNIKFLVVADRNVARDLLEILRAFGAGEIKYAADDRSAIALLRDFAPDVVIADCWMAPAGGIALARHLRAHAAPADRFVPIIMITSDTRPTCVQRARDAGVNELLIRPFPPLALRARIENAIRYLRRFPGIPHLAEPDRRRGYGEMPWDTPKPRIGKTSNALHPGRSY